MKTPALFDLTGRVAVDWWQWRIGRGIALDWPKQSASVRSGVSAERLYLTTHRDGHAKRTEMIRRIPRRQRLLGQSERNATAIPAIATSHHSHPAG